MKEVVWGPIPGTPEFSDPAMRLTEGDEGLLPELDPNARLSMAEKARLYDEQIEAAEAVSSVLASLENVPGVDDATEEALIATLGLEADLLSLEKPRRISIFDMCIRGFSDMPEGDKESWKKISWMLLMSVFVLLGIVAVILYGEMTVIVLPPKQPIGAYRVVEVHEGDSFFDYYNVYNGPDSKGSNGYIYYRNLQYSRENGLVKILSEPSPTNITRHLDEQETHGDSQIETDCENCEAQRVDEETFVYLGTKPTEEGPRDSVRLEGKRRFNRGLFIFDVRHMPTGCGTWPAFWLTDENNWPLNGEIDIVEGVNYQTTAKTALHTTQGCSNFNVPEGLATGGWDTAIGVPDAKTGIPDMTLRYAKNCYCYDKHQWLNQGCVAVDNTPDRLGIPLNRKGGGIFVLEWDPANRHIRSWVFLHSEAPQNLLDSIRTASNPINTPRVAPDPRQWPLPYGYFGVGEDTDCPARHFQNMHLVINLAFCGSVAGNRYFMDCPNQFKQYKTCEEWVRSNPDELKEAYWKIKGVYVYEREWERDWSAVNATKIS